VMRENNYSFDANYGGKRITKPVLLCVPARH
jgi:hypothetical protein